MTLGKRPLQSQGPLMTSCITSRKAAVEAKGSVLSFASLSQNVGLAVYLGSGLFFSYFVEISLTYYLISNIADPFLS